VTEAFPLAWPEGWPRTPEGEKKDGRYSFKRQQDTGRGYRMGQPWSFAAARDALLEELWKHNPSSVVLSSNFQPGKNGPMEGRRRPEDEGIAVYFQRKGKPYVMACDRYHDAEGNMRSLALALEAMRQLERHGGGTMMERAYEGFAALPPPKSCWEILDLKPGASADDVRRAYRAKAPRAHPDGGGSHDRMAELNAARDEALKLAGPA
jgi:hypothetical protein